MTMGFSAGPPVKEFKGSEELNDLVTKQHGILVAERIEGGAVSSFISTNPNPA